jgi:hypothetical protein
LRRSGPSRREQLRHKAPHLAAFAVLLLIGTYLFGAVKVESTALPTDGRIPDPIRKVLAASGYHVTLDDGATLDVWFRAEVPTGKYAGDSAGASYSDFAESTLFGVISFPAAWQDYRGQAVPAGLYTLRYELHPNDGNHLGVASDRDFLLLVPIGLDSDPNASFSFQQLVGLSKQATHSKHPSPLNMPAPDAKQFPAVTQDSEDHMILQVKIKTSSGEVPIALVVRGKSSE